MPVCVTVDARLQQGCLCLQCTQETKKPTPSHFHSCVRSDVTLSFCITEPQDSASYSIPVLCVSLALPHHAGGAPDVGRGAVSGPDQNLDGAVLPCLDVLRKVLVLRERRERRLRLAERSGLHLPTGLSPPCRPRLPHRPCLHILYMPHLSPPRMPRDPAPHHPAGPAFPSQVPPPPHRPRPPVPGPASHHPAGVAQVGDLHSQGVGVSGVQRVHQQVCCSGLRCTGK